MRVASPAGSGSLAEPDARQTLYASTLDPAGIAVEAAP